MKKLFFAFVLLLIVISGCKNNITGSEDITEKECTDECTGDSCSGMEYIKCEENEEGCREQVNLGRTIGKCSVGCINDGDCDDEKCISNKCQCLVPKKEMPYNLSDGVKSVEMYFEEGAPPEWIFDEGRFEFDIVFNVVNLGQGVVKPGYVEFANLHPEDFDTGSFKKYLKYNLNPGSLGQIKFEELTYLVDEHGTSDMKIDADFCYQYNTVAASNICIDKHECARCTINEKKQVFNSDSPVHITSVSEQEISNVFYLFLKIENLGSGLVFKKQEDCDYTEINNSDTNLVWFDIHTDLSINFECSAKEDKFIPPGYIELDESGIALINCSLDTSKADNVLEEWLVFLLEFNYLDKTETETEVRTSR
ncbi:hypothetical protein JXB41_01305 [Candidatus Woesearchaeota archaeon]|nr:hypothetical protein [Candidatus Woesearchaeota archaeon]